tara:strand:+ start:546 stop:659 length:114 start_codon:yes stop_codon:yes gene_type:complete
MKRIIATIIIGILFYSCESLKIEYFDSGEISKKGKAN